MGKKKKIKKGGTAQLLLRGVSLVSKKWWICGKLFKKSAKEQIKNTQQKEDQGRPAKASPTADNQTRSNKPKGIPNATN